MNPEKDLSAMSYEELVAHAFDLIMQLPPEQVEQVLSKYIQKYGGAI